MNDQTPKPTRIISNAKITSTILGGKASDGRCFSSFINLDYGGSGQGFGGFCFDSWNQDKQRRIGVAWGMEFIARTLEVVGVEAWEDLVGKHVRVDHEEFGQIYRIGHIVENKWFDPKADLDFLMPAAKKID